MTKARKKKRPPPKPKSLPAGDILICPRGRCAQPLYAMRAKDGRLLAVCTACKFHIAPTAQVVTDSFGNPL